MIITARPHSLLCRALY